MISVGIVIIGRNEGERLKRCFESIRSGYAHKIYVDSGSTDGSIELAKNNGVVVVELDMSKPFNAARARNEGFRALMKSEPAVDYVQFVDGDCSMDEKWLERAANELSSRENIAVLCGKIVEQFPEASIYNALANLEWNRKPGETESCGGIALMKISALTEAGLFDETVPAGEEPELCNRIRQKGGLIWRTEGDMARHDIHILKFSHWWKRQYRSGYSGLDVVRRFQLKQFKTQVNSARLWTLGVFGAIVLLALTGYLLRGITGATIGALLGVALPPAQMARMFLRAKKSGYPQKIAFFHALLTMISKWGQLLGQWGYMRDRKAGQGAKLIEYKSAANMDNTSPFKKDLARYPRRPWLKEQSIWAIAVYRFGKWGDRRKTRVFRWLINRIYWIVFRIVETLTGISFCKTVEIGPGLRIHHFGNIFIHGNVVIGAHCTLRQGVTIGNREDGGSVPVLEDDVECGAYAQILGGVRIGKGAKIGAMSVVLTDVPPGATAVGIPARIIPNPNTDRSENSKLS